VSGAPNRNEWDRPHVTRPHAAVRPSGDAASSGNDITALRTEVAALRAEVRDSLADLQRDVASIAAAQVDLTAIRGDLSATLSGANVWFVRFRDELFERLAGFAQTAAPSPVQGVASERDGPDVAEALKDVQRQLQRLMALVGRASSPATNAGQPGAQARRKPPERPPSYEDLIRMLVTGDFER
jgi:hypothetical protein